MRLPSGAAVGVGVQQHYKPERDRSEPLCAAGSDAEKRRKRCNAPPERPPPRAQGARAMVTLRKATSRVT
eukprot:7628923-Pyramimonas_sp.AAC.1